jgi:hypothetical protein
MEEGTREYLCLLQQMIPVDAPIDFVSAVARGQMSWTGFDATYVEKLLMSPSLCTVAL